MLEEGTYKVSGRLKIYSSGVVLRGSSDKTILKAEGQSRETLIRIVGINDVHTEETTKIITDYLPANSTRVEVKNSKLFSVGEPVFIRRFSNEKWITLTGNQPSANKTVTSPGWVFPSLSVSL